MRRIDRKARKRLGFVDYTHVFRAMTPEEKWRQRHIFAGSLIDPKAIIAITGTGA